MPGHLLQQLPDEDQWAAGLGNLSVLGDDLLLNIFNQLPAHTLAHCAVVSRTFYCFANHDELWRAHTLEVLPSH